MSRFKTGRLVITPGINAYLKERGLPHMFLIRYVIRHVNGDWGELCAEDYEANEQALADGSRILSKYRLPSDHESGGRAIYVITEAEDDDGERRYTTILFPEEY